MEKHLARFLNPSEVIHHKNSDRKDNRLENLELFSSNAEHLALTLKGKIPLWSEQGKENMRLACRKKTSTTYFYTQEARQLRRGRVTVANAIRRLLKLDALPNKKTMIDYLTAQGTSYPVVLEKALRQEPLF
jgi:hypothetical protein